ncbi:DNA-directed RNA polymerase, subunit 2, partial [Kipferlia bialata]
VEVGLPLTKDFIPVGIVFRALNIDSDRALVAHCSLDLHDSEMVECLKPSLLDIMGASSSSLDLSTLDGARDFIARRGSALERGLAGDRQARIEAACRLLTDEMLPHLDTLNEKAWFLGYCVHRLLACHLCRRSPDDRDHCANKRLDLSGPLLGELFRRLFLNLRRNIERTARDKIKRNQMGSTALHDVVDTKVITRGLLHCMNTGNWTVNATDAPKTGVCQALIRITFASALSHLRKLNSPLAREGKDAAPRQLHNTQFGYLCPAETPEGHSCGLVKALSLLCRVTV